MNVHETLEKVADQTVETVHEVKKVSRLRRMVPGAVSLKVGRTIFLAQKNSPTILFAGGIVGMVATTVLACRATLKVESVLEKIESDKADAKQLHEAGTEKYSEKDYRQDMAYLYIRSGVQLTKLYGPTFILGITSIAALTGAHNILTKRNIALTAAYASVAKGFAEYRARVVDEYGEDKDREFRYGVEEQTIIDEKPNGKVEKTVVKRVGPDGPSIYAKFFDSNNKNWNGLPESNIFFLKLQQQWLNDQLKARGHVFLNEAYDEIGFERTKEGSVVGWLWDRGGDDYIDFGIWRDDRLDKLHEFFQGRESRILLDFNVDGVIYDKL